MTFPRRTIIGLLICLLLSACSDAGPETATSLPSPSSAAASLPRERRLACLPDELEIVSHADGPASEGWRTPEEALMRFLANHSPEAKFSAELFVTENLTNSSATMVAVVDGLTRGVFYLRKYPDVGWSVGDFRACNGFTSEGR